MAKCGICGSQPERAFTARVLNRHEATYWFCPTCEFLCTPEPGWLKEAYGDAIARADTGLVVRNLDLAEKAACVLYEHFDRAGRFLDTAGGTGLLTRLMRDTGFDFRWEDPYCTNVLAPGFEAAKDSREFEAVTAFEVLEHLTDPLAFVRDCLARSRTGTLIFTTELFQGRPPAPDWWYYAFQTGQHISFFTARTLAEMARRLDVHVHSARGLHMFTRQDIASWRYRWTLWRARRGLIGRVRRAMQSLTDSDHRTMLGETKP